MWICRHCAAHVKDEVLTCPCCGTPAPARLQPEFAEQVSTQIDTVPEPREPSIPIKLGFPPLEKQSSKRAVEIGALIGFLFTLSSGLFTITQGRLRGPNVGSFVTDVIIILFASIFCGVFGGMIGGLIGLTLLPLVDLLLKLTGRTVPAPDLPPHSVLARTETLGTRNQERDFISGSAEIMEPQQTNCSSIQDLTSGLKAHNQDLPSL